MPTAQKITAYALVLTTVFAVGGLAGWYYFLRMKQNDIQTVSIGRGLGVAEPTTHQAGSTFNNITETIGGHTQVGATGNPAAQSGGGSTGGFAGYQGGTGIGTLSQFGFSGTTSTIGQSISNDTFSSDNAPATPRLWHVSQNAVAGFGFVGTTATDTKIYFAERATGYIFSLDPLTGSALRLTNTLTPKTYEALFAADGAVIERSLDGSAIRTFAGTVGTTTSGTTASLTGVELERNIDSIAINPATKKIFYTTQEDGKTAAYSVQWDGTKRTPIYSTLVGSWRLIALGGRLIIVNKASDTAPGYAYEINYDGTLKPLVRNVLGLTILPQASPDLLLYSSSASASLFSLQAGTTTPNTVTLRTITDKCAWLPATPTASKKKTAPLSTTAFCAVPTILPQGSFADAWYQGRSHTTDQWWQINLASGTTSTLFDSNDYTVPLQDVQDPVIDQSGTYLAYKDARDESLWVLRLHE